MSRRFASPFDVPTPEGAEGWEEMYQYSSLFLPGRRSHDEGAFWFQDGVHWPEVLSPWDATLFEFAIASLSQYNTRQLRLPPSDGIAFRILNGYAYLSPVPAPAEDIEARIAQFTDRAGFYYRNWDGLLNGWKAKIHALVGELESLDFRALPDVEDVGVVKSGGGVGSGWHLQEQYRRLLDLALRLWQYHFEFLNLGYAAYLDFFGFCKKVWPGIPDLSIARMVSGVDVDLFRPDDELKRLARLAIELDLTDDLAGDDVEEIWTRLRATDAGLVWLESFTEETRPWFNFSSGSGFYHTDQVWIEHPGVPLGFINGYIDAIREGGDIARPVAALRAERDRIVDGYRALLPDGEYRDAFQRRLDLTRTVFPYVENHNFYVEHWGHAAIWRQMRALGALLAAQGFWADADDIFYLRRTEVEDALWDYYAAWATPGQAAGPGHWGPVVERRRGMVAALRRWRPPPALGEPPEVVTEPFTVMLWGITSQSIAGWLGRGDDGADVRGFAASPGVAEGRARVILSADALGSVREGEVLVAPLTAPSWAPIFGRIAATVTDTGGMMSHAAIVCREYRLPAVTGTGVATSVIRTGQWVRVDGSTGIVTVVDEPGDA